MANKRYAIGGLSLSAAALVGLLMHEGYSDNAIIPVKGDVPTVGFGSTKRDDGSPVQISDTITPQRAVARSYGHIQKDESGIKNCITVPVSQKEYDILVNFSYQYGVPILCKSTMVKEINSEHYEFACKAYLKYKFVAGRDCSIRANNCYGVWTRSQERYKQCMEAQ